MGRSRYKIFESQLPYFLTGTIVNWIPLFANPHIASIIFDSWNYLQKENRLTIYAYVLMENHYHLIAKAENLSKQIANFRSFTARRVINLLNRTKAVGILKQLRFSKQSYKCDRKYQLWQEGSHPQMIDDEKAMSQKVEYIHNNPVKRGYVDNPTHWRYSSARNYAGLQSLLDITFTDL